MYIWNVIPYETTKFNEKFENTPSDFIFTCIEQSLKYFKLFIDFNLITAQELCDGL